jgi:hypothetical protein
MKKDLGQLSALIEAENIQNSERVLEILQLTTSVMKKDLQLVGNPADHFL